MLNFQENPLNPSENILFDQYSQAIGIAFA